MSVNNVDYYVPFSYYDRQQEDNILIKVDYHKKTKVAGSLRFNYMFPVPKKCLIQKKALKTYNRVLKGDDEELLKNSCLFLVLEEACIEYN